MRILVVGLNHKTSPVGIRQRLAFDTEQTVSALKQLKNRFGESEFVLLSTCNRVELYCAAERKASPSVGDLAGFMSEFHGVGLDEFRNLLYVYEDADAVRHLLKVASSLDSMVVGEPQILRQVKDSFRFACSAKSTGKILNHLFHCSFAAAKNVHSSTSISSGRVSVAGVAVELATQLFADIFTAKVVLVGAGEMGVLVLQHLLKNGCEKITIVNRSFERGMNVAGKYGVAAEKWEMLEEKLAEADIVIASAASDEYLFTKESFSKIMHQRGDKELLIFDIAVPRNFGPDINEIENMHLYSIDDLSEQAEKNRNMREEDITEAIEIVGKRTDDFMDWFGARDIGPLIGQMREKLAQISQEELERFLIGFEQESSYKRKTKLMVDRIMNKLLHCVIKNIGIVAKKHGSKEAAKLVESIVEQAESTSSEPSDA